MSTPNVINLPVRLTEQTSQIHRSLSEDGRSWEIVSADLPVSEKFNKWADENDMNPYGTPSITRSITWMPDGRSYVETSTLCAAAVSREDHAKMELSLREQIIKIGLAVNPPQTPNTHATKPASQAELKQAALIDVNNLSELPPLPPNAGAAKEVTLPTG